MAKKVATLIVQEPRGRGRPARYASAMSFQLAVGLDDRRRDQLERLQRMLQTTSAGEVSLADVMRTGLDMLATSMLGEVNEV